MRVADYIAARVAQHGVRHVFMITGGGAMHLNDAFGRNKDLTLVYNHHEQASAMAAEAYTRLSGRLAVVNVTTGPGGVNALNGVYGAYTDSIGMVIFSGQVKRETMVSSYDLPIRQLGDQEIAIVPMAKPVCKYAEVLRDPSEVRYMVEKALYLAMHGRPGPVWIDVPVDVQGAHIDPDTLRGFDPEAEGDVLPNMEAGALKGKALEAPLLELLQKLRAAKRPVIMPGTGVRIAGAYEEFLKLIDRLGVPVVTAFNAHDLVTHDHPLYAGRPGTVGDRAGNFAVQNADFLLVLGCRLNIRQISYNWKSFAREAYQVMIDADRAELVKPTVDIDLPIHADLKEAITLLTTLPYEKMPEHAEYVRWCHQRVQRYPVVLEEYRAQQTPINPYCFMGELFGQLKEGDVTVTANATACVTAFQSAIIKKDQRLFSNSGSASMGYDLPAAIGAHYACGKRVICFAGDGSIMMNLQELQTIASNQLPIKLFVLNNNGYHSITQTQKNFFSDNIVGCGPASGVTFPDYVALAKVFGIGAARCERLDDLPEAIRTALDADGPAMLEIIIDGDQPFAPKTSSRRLPDGRMVSAALEDLAPFLSREELAENMIISLMAE